MDNTLTPQQAFQNLGNNLEGTDGFPWCLGTGDLTSGSTVAIDLGAAQPNANTFLVIGTEALNAPLLGGVLVPDIDSPGGSAFAVTTDANGRHGVGGTWPPGVPSGFELYVQYWVEDAGGVLGHAASNAIVGTTP